MEFQVIQGFKEQGAKLPIVAIDGPAGAGKSTAARLLAARLGFTLVDTGALYRSLALHAVEKGLSLEDESALVDLAKTLQFQFGSLAQPTRDSNGQLQPPKLHVYCNGIDVTDQIRTPELGLLASRVSKFPKLRQALLDLQRSFGKNGGIVMEGRDIGSVIFPEAEMKFFLSASVKSRAQRRWEELKAAGIETTLEQVEKETIQRDEQDTQRTVAPLVQVPDARLIDSTSRSLSEVVEEMFHQVLAYMREHSSQRSSSVDSHTENSENEF